MNTSLAKTLHTKCSLRVPSCQGRCTPVLLKCLLGPAAHITQAILHTAQYRQYGSADADTACVQVAGHW